MYQHIESVPTRKDINNMKTPIVLQMFLYQQFYLSHGTEKMSFWPQK